MFILFLEEGSENCASFRPQQTCIRLCQKRNPWLPSSFCPQDLTSAFHWLTEPSCELASQQAQERQIAKVKPLRYGAVLEKGLRGGWIQEQTAMATTSHSLQTIFRKSVPVSHSVSPGIECRNWTTEFATFPLGFLNQCTSSISRYV